MSNYNNIPAELKSLKQWVVWRWELRDCAKPTKVPYSPWQNGGKALTADSVKLGTKAKDTWGTFEQACSAPLTCLQPCDPTLPISQTGFTGIGFVFSEDDPYCGIDLDDTHGDQEAYLRQLKVFKEFNSYSELSVSGTGMHIIIKATLPTGRRRADIEIYSKERYFTFTGNVQNSAPIEERQQLANLLYEQMGGPPEVYVYGEETEQTKSDEEILSIATNASNSDKFNRLYTGDYHSLYPSQSEADFALVDIIAYYTQNAAQIARIFRMSALGQRDKANRDNYVGYMVRKSFDKQLPKVDIDGIKILIENKMAEARAKQLSGAAPEPGRNSAAPSQNGPEPRVLVDAASHGVAARVNGIFPPGLLGEVAQYILDASPRPVPEIALAGAIALLSGITGRAYNISGTGLNQYILLLAKTGRGKDAISNGISKLMYQVKVSVPTAGDFHGPGEIASSAGLIKWLNKKPAVYSILGEVGLLLQQMASPHANSNMLGLQRALLQFYSKSGKGQIFDPMAYSDQDKNTSSIASPSLTLIGESVPERFYEVLDENMIGTGLLPRFMVFEYTGKREYLREGTELIQPSFRLVQGIADLAAHALGLSHNGNVQNIPMDEEATSSFREFEKWTTDEINEAKTQVYEELWNRAHLKALKLAAVCAVGINPHNPLITINETLWATNIVVEQTRRLIGKFETGQVGATGGSENKQLALVMKVVAHYLSRPFEEVGKAQIDGNMHAAGVITESVIQRKLTAMAAFKHDKLGPSAAIKRAIRLLVDADELREIPKTQMQQRFGTGPKAFVVANPARFVELIGND